MPNPSRRGPWPEARLFGNKFPPGFRDEFTHDGNDNWIPDTQRGAALSNPERWKKHLQTYVIAVLKYFELELERAKALLPNLRIRKSEKLILLTAEMCWDFASENPLDAVAKLQERFFSLVAGRRRARFYSTIEVNAYRNAPSLVADVSSGEQLRVYAKGNARVRMEVVFMFKKDGYRLKGGHTSEHWRDLPGMLEALAAHAARRVNWSFAHFRNQAQIIPSQISADDLLLQIGAHSRDLETANTVRGYLVHFSSIAAKGITKTVARALQRLSTNGVLRYRPDAGQGGNYVVTAPYLSALRELQERRNL